MSNLPPGVSESSIPGNGPLDAVAEGYPETMSYEDIAEQRAREKADADNDRAVTEPWFLRVGVKGAIIAYGMLSAHIAVVIVESSLGMSATDINTAGILVRVACTTYLIAVWCLLIGVPLGIFLATSEPDNEGRNNE